SMPFWVMARCGRGSCAWVVTALTVSRMVRTPTSRRRCGRWPIRSPASRRQVARQQERTASYSEDRVSDAGGFVVLKDAIEAGKRMSFRHRKCSKKTPVKGAFLRFYVGATGFEPVTNRV